MATMISRHPLWRWWFLCLAIFWQCSRQAHGVTDPTALVISTEQDLVCKEIAADDGSTELACHFRLKHIPQEVEEESPSFPLVELNSCPHPQNHQGEQAQSVGDGEGKDNNYCVSASISIRPNEIKGIQNEPVDANEESSSETLHTNTAATQAHSNSMEDAIDDSTSRTTSPDLPKQEAQETLRVGAATYRPPYSQYGSKVADVLARYPHQHGTDPIALANWYLQLGMAHFPNEGDEANQNDAYDWYSYPLELTLNALRLAITAFGDDVDAYSVEQKVFVASVHYSLGEAYFIDPELTQLEEALQEYQNAYDLYEDLLEVNPLQKQQIWDVPDTERRYADACTKLGMSMIQNLDPMMMMMINDPMGTMTMNINSNINMNEDEQEAHTRLVSSDDTDDDLDDAQGNSPLAKPQSMFEKSILIFERLLRQEFGTNDAPKKKVDWFIIDLRMGLSMALQHAATTGVLMSDPQELSDAVAKFQYAIRLQLEDILPYVRIDGPEYVSTKTTLADLYICLADAALQAGRYDLAKEAYSDAMQWHEKNAIPVAPLPPVTEEQELALEDHLELLREYRSMVGNKNAGAQQQKNDQKLYPKGNDDYDDYYYYERDDGYEGDMMANIGAMYMAKGQIEAAISYMEQAVIKYESEADGQAMADLKLNLAMVYYRARRFEDSERLHLEALSAFQQLYGDGVNPFVQILDRYEDMLQQQQQQQGGVQQQKPPLSEAEGSTDDPSGEVKKVIDLDQYRSSIKNATAAATVKEEL